MDFRGILLLAGRILYGGFFIKSGIKHFVQINGMSQYAGMKGVPFPKLAVGGSGLLILLGGAGVLLGAYVEIALAFIILFLVPVTLTMHAFWSDTDPNMKMMNSTNFYKNAALLGAALMLFSISPPWPYSL